MHTATIRNEQMIKTLYEKGELRPQVSGSQCKYNMQCCCNFSNYFILLLSFLIKEFLHSALQRNPSNVDTLSL